MALRIGASAGASGSDPITANMMERFYVLRSQGESFAFIREYVKMSFIPEHPKEKKERQRIIEALEQNDREITKTAENLEMSRSTLWRKMKKYGITV